MCDKCWSTWTFDCWCMKKCTDNWALITTPEEIDTFWAIVRWTPWCGDVMIYACDKELDSISICDLADDIFDCKCLDLFDTCCMPECKPWTFLRINDCTNCDNKYEFVSACDIRSEIVNTDKCWFDISITCADLLPLFDVSTELASDPFWFKWSCINGKLTLSWEIPKAVECFEELCNLPTEIPECDDEYRANEYSCVSAANDCPDCEDPTDCTRRTLEFCPEQKKLRMKEDECCNPCLQNSRARSWLNASITIAQAPLEEKKYYLTEASIPQLDAAWWTRVGAWVLQSWWESADTISWENKLKRHCTEYNFWAHLLNQKWDHEYVFKGSYEVNKWIHWIRFVWIMLDCVTWEITTPDQWRYSGIQGTKYEGQPQAPNPDFWRQWCNDTTTAYSWPQTWNTDVATYSMWIDSDRRSFIISDWDYFENPTRFIPWVKISTVITWDDDASIPWQVSIIWKDWNTWDWWDEAKISSRNIDSLCERKIIYQNCWPCCCEDDSCDCDIWSGSIQSPWWEFEIPTNEQQLECAPWTTYVEDFLWPWIAWCVPTTIPSTWWGCPDWYTYNADTDSCEFDS